MDNSIAPLALFLTTILAVMTCMDPPLSEALAQKECREISGDLPSRVIYESTGLVMVPYLVVQPAKDGVFPELGCIHLASGEIRGRHFRVCEDEIPWHEDVNPWTMKARQTPYAAGDTAYVWYWRADNPFHD